MKRVISFLPSILAACVAGYVCTVALRNEGSGTHLGSDTIYSVWGAVSTILIFSIFRWARAEKKERKDASHVLAVAIPIATACFWTWLVFSGHVVSHESMLSIK